MSPRNERTGRMSISEHVCDRGFIHDADLRKELAMTAYDKIIDHAKGSRHVAGVPRRITPEILAVCGTLGGESPPVYLPVTPAPGAFMARCYMNVEYCLDEGDEMRFGWLIWEMPGVFLTAEHHAVLERDGRLYDVTPQVHGETRVLFLPIDDPRSQPASIPNRYTPLVEHPLIREAVRLMEENQRIAGAGEYDSPRFRRNDEECATKLDDYFRLLLLRRQRAVKKVGRAKKKAARKRR